MPNYYKFLNKQDVDYVLQEETILISKQSHYRSEYERTGDEWIGDPRDGDSRLRLNLFTSKPSQEDIDAAARVSIGIDKDSRNIWMFGNESIERYDEYIFCVAKGDLESLTAAMCTRSERNKNPYDACIEINDMDALCKLLGDGCEGYARAPMRGQFVVHSNSPLEDVQYVDGFRDARLEQHHPFVKRTIFRHQCEARIIMSVSPNTDVPTIIVKVPGMSKVMSRIF